MGNKTDNHLLSRSKEFSEDRVQIAKQVREQDISKWPHVL